MKIKGLKVIKAMMKKSKVGKLVLIDIMTPDA